MNALVSLGIILFFALLAGHLVKYARIPEVTGYILAGVIVGPSVLGWLTHEKLSTLAVFSEVALGLILFSLGSVFELPKLRLTGMRVVLITASESVLAASLVGAGMFLAGQPWQVSLLLAAISMETAAASTLMVMRECNSQGELTETLTGVIAVNNLFCLLAFSLVAAAIELGGRSTALAAGLYQAIFPLIWQMTGAVALGYLLGVLLSYWSDHVKEHGETLILMVGAVLLCVGASQWLEVSPLVASLAVGATMVNLSPRSRRLFAALSRTDPPLYAIFFVIAGADLNLSLLATLGPMGLIYVVGRMAGKFVGSRFGAARSGMRPDLRQLLGISMFSQAGLAIGLVLVINDRFPALAPTVTTIVLASVAVFELMGPVLARLALVRSGEARPQQPEPAVLLD